MLWDLVDARVVGTDGTFNSLAPHVAKHFVSVDVRYFDFSDREASLVWFTSGSTLGPHAGTAKIGEGGMGEDVDVAVVGGDAGTCVQTLTDLDDLGSCSLIVSRRWDRLLSCVLGALTKRPAATL